MPILAIPSDRTLGFQTNPENLLLHQNLLHLEIELLLVYFIDKSEPALTELLLTLRYSSKGEV
jgi:hypothetical protein